MKCRGTVRGFESAHLAAFSLAGIGAFQCALAAGAPWGGAAWGGKFPGKLPPAIRVASGLSAGVLVALAWYTLQPNSTSRTRVVTGAAIYTSVNAVMNLLSPSPLERMIATPMAACAAASLWGTRVR